MSITSDIRGYADTAIEQGRQVLEQAQSQFNDVTGLARENVSGLSAKASESVNGLRAQAEKAINLDAIKAAVEPYLAQAKGYTHSVTDRAEALLNTAKKDPRVAKAVQTAESVGGTVLDTVQAKVVKPVQSLTGLGVKPAPAPKPAVAATAKPAATKPAAKKTPARKSTAGKSTAKKDTEA